MRAPPAISKADLRAQCERLLRLRQVGEVLHSTLDPDEALRLIVREAVGLMKAASGSVVLVNPTTGFLEIQAAHGLPPSALQLKLRVGEGVTGWVARTGRAARVGDVTRDPRYLSVRPGVRSELAVPFALGGEVRGVLNVDADRPDAFTEGDEVLLADLAREAARVIENTWRYEQWRVKAGLFEALVKVSQTINSALNVDEALQAVTREACSLMHGRMCCLRLLDETGAWLHLRAAHGAGEAYRSKPRLSVADSLLGVVVRRQKPLQVENVHTSPRYQNVAVARAEGLVSLLSVPLVYRRETIGTLNVYTGEPHQFSDEEIRVLGALADLSAVAIERARLYERIVDAEEQVRQNEKLSALGLLAAEVAHEIRNPLAVLKMLYHSLDLRFPPADPRARDVQIMGEKIEQLDRIVDQVLDFARRAEPEPALVDVNRLLDDLILLIRHKLRQLNITLHRELAPRLPPLKADAAQLGQAFLNLALNATEAMPQGGRLTLATRPARWSRRSPNPTHVVIVFKDTGSGMTTEQQQRLFRPLLSTTKPKGTGLGLMLVARVVEAHHGQVRLSSRPARGTTITIVLPAQPG